MFTICLPDYPTIQCKSFTSLFTILPPPPCPISSFTMISLSPTYDQTYTLVQDSVISWSLPLAALTRQYPTTCNYAQNVEVSISPSFFDPTSFKWTVTPTSIDFETFTSNLVDAGLKTITVTSTLMNYNVPGQFTPSVS